MRETLLDRWKAENAAVKISPSALQQCAAGAVRGALLGVALLSVLGLIGWLGLL